MADKACDFDEMPTSVSGKKVSATGAGKAKGKGKKGLQNLQNFQKRFAKK